MESYWDKYKNINITLQPNRQNRKVNFEVRLPNSSEQQKRIVRDTADVLRAKYLQYGIDCRKIRLQKGLTQKEIA
ncbi:hypothetical protein KY334_05775, partial [Candidatus Woesearchaeota archaeon]|nr:hypothetical protein [Candidatus Woesearchaeota archaeon]